MGSFLSSLWKWINDASKLIAPQRCAICGRRLRSGEEAICLSCYLHLPFTNIRGEKGNRIERLFWMKIPIVRANSFIHYYPHNASTHVILKLKYMERPQFGIILGRIMAMDLIDTDFFDGMDVILPIPLAKERLKKRGYNQSEMLAKGVSMLTGIPIDTKSVTRTISNPTQTRLNTEERRKNVAHIFALSPHHTLDNKHILLIDDVMTTGATLLSCAKEITKARNVKISILTLALARNPFSIKKTYHIPSSLFTIAKAENDMEVKP